MILQLRKILLVAVTMVMISSAMKCDKLIPNSSSVGNNGAMLTQTVLETGRYVVTTTRNVRSNKVQSLIERLNGASNIQYSDQSFTATLVPKDLKKVCILSHYCCKNHRQTDTCTHAHTRIAYT